MFEFLRLTPKPKKRKSLSHIPDPLRENHGGNSSEAAGGATAGIRHTTKQLRSLISSKRAKPHDQSPYLQADDTMGKSNKFDCTNRRNEGVDLGKSIGDAALKELEKTKKDAVRHAFKARKASLSSVTSGDDEAAGIHYIDLIAPSKALTDDGVAAMAEGLYAAVKAGTNKASIVLEGLNLRDNKLTTRALATLAPLVDLAQNDLKTIVLSDNAITVVTDEQAQQWETFLRAFKDCKTLRRLDLSGNQELGARALEIFSKVHSKEPAVEPIALGGNRSVYTLEETLENDDAEDATDTRPSDDVSELMDPMTFGTYLRRRCGLRSIPYISLQNVGIDDTGALWLSYILADHHLPSQLISEVNAAPATSSVDAYQQDSVEGGIDWRGHEGSLGKDGLSLLTKTEAIRKLIAHGEYTSPHPGSPDAASTKSLQPRRLSRASVGDRRSSIRSISTDDGSEYDVSEVESIRKRIQRHIIESRGIGSVELWKAGLDAIVSSRKLAYIAAPTLSRQTYAGPFLFTTEDAVLKCSTGREQRLDSAANILETSGIKATTPMSSMTRNAGKSYAATLAAMSPSKAQENALTEVTNTPTTPKLTFKAHRKGAFSEGPDLQSLTEKLSTVKIERANHRPERFVERQKQIQSSQDFEYRNTALACQLPLPVFDRILDTAFAPAPVAVQAFGLPSEVAETQEASLNKWKGAALLSERQKKRVFEWGQKRDTLAREREWAGKAHSGQLLVLLGNVGCLAYER